MDEIVKRAQSGDNDAFVELVNMNRLSMYRVAKSYVKNDDDVADVISESIIVAYEKINTLKEPQYFNTWLTRILINKCKFFIKRKKEYVYMESTELENTINDKRSCSEKAFAEEKFYELIGDLPEKYRTVLVLYYREEFSIKEISEILDLSENTIKTRLKRAREQVVKRKEAKLKEKNKCSLENESELAGKNCRLQRKKAF